MDIHCVVTGQTKASKSVIVRNTPVKPVTLAALPGYEFHRVWGSDGVVQLPSDGAPPPQPLYFPPRDGFRFGFFTVPPESSTSIEQMGTEAAAAEIQHKLPGVLEFMEPGHPGMHTTDTVDFDVVVSGEVVLELDDGAEVVLKAGDCVVQNGTRHAWRNRSKEKCVIAFTLVGAERRA
jgi:mannose-6-phosphate isomerase-like protein (cupin superfamily)